MLFQQSYYINRIILRRFVETPYPLLAIVVFTPTPAVKIQIAKHAYNP